NLFSDVQGMAPVIDANLQNPWGFGFGNATPFWAADQNSGVSTLYNANGTVNPTVVTIPPSPTGNPTGVVNNGTPDFLLTPGGPKANFIFDTLNGTIAAWNSGATAVIKVDNSAAGAVYTGLALANDGTRNLLYAADNAHGVISVFGPDFSS